MIEVDEAKEVLEDLLQASNFDINMPELDRILEAFKKFSRIKVDCAHDDFLFQCGVFDFTGESLFYWDIVRQFIVEKNKAYSHMEQLHFEVKFEVNKELENLLAVEWSTVDLDGYFNNLMNMDEVILPFKKYAPRSINIFQETI